MSRVSVVRRAREGSGHTQARAADALGLGRATLSVYETGRSVPSERKTWEILETLALGERSPGEARPRVFVSFSLAGQRLLSVGGAVLEFRALENAARAADELDHCLLDRVVIVPAWESFLTSILERNRSRAGTSQRVVAFEALGRPFEEVLNQALQELIVHVQPWFQQAISERTTTPSASGGSE